MHELALSRAIVDAALAHAEGRRVVAVNVSLGALRQAVPESLELYFQILSDGTLCEGALLNVRQTPARLRCECGEEWELTEPSFRCPACGGAETTVLSGEELRVDSIEVEEEAGASRGADEAGGAARAAGREEARACTARR
jgi:hydrogenase nickel incorporation protein HypA/HybF